MKMKSDGEEEGLSQGILEEDANPTIASVRQGIEAGIEGQAPHLEIKIRCVRKLSS
jgi:hypothetical protein